MYNSSNYQNIIISDTILVGIGLNGRSSEIAPIQEGLKSAKSLQARIKKNFKMTSELSNHPYSNFEIIGYSCYKSTNGVYIQDQRGIKIFVDMEYFFSVLKEFTIVNGVIVNDCVWACYNSRNILVPVNSEIYKTCKENTNRKLKRVSTRDIKFGDLCLMEDGATCTYIGYYVCWENSFSSIGKMPKQMSSKKHFFYKDKLFYISSPVVSEILKENTIDTNGKTKIEYINSLISNYKVSPKVVPKEKILAKGSNELFKFQCTYFNSNILLYKDNSLHNGSIDRRTIYQPSTNSYIYEFILKINGELHKSSSLEELEGIIDNIGYKKPIYYIKDIDPETNKEVEINISNS